MVREKESKKEFRRDKPLEPDDLCAEQREKTDKVI